MNAWTCTNTGETDPGEGLTLEKFLEVYNRINAMLPVMTYKTSKYAPLVNKDGKPAICVLPLSADLMSIWGYAPVTGELVILHPDNLPELERRCAGRYRLVPLEVIQE